MNFWVGVHEPQCCESSAPSSSTGCTGYRMAQRMFRTATLNANWCNSLYEAVAVPPFVLSQACQLDCTPADWLHRLQQLYGRRHIIPGLGAASEGGTTAGKFASWLKADTLLSFNGVTLGVRARRTSINCSTGIARYRYAAGACLASLPPADLSGLAGSNAVLRCRRPGTQNDHRPA